MALYSNLLKKVIDPAPAQDAALPGGGGGDDPAAPEDQSETAVVAERRTEIRPPSLYRVIILNDDFTPMEFVVAVLEKFFDKSHAEATEVMLSVHNKGSGICGIFPFEVAETKVAQVTEYAREQEHPLQLTTERV